MEMLAWSDALDWKNADSLLHQNRRHRLKWVLSGFLTVVSRELGKPGLTQGKEKDRKTFFLSWALLYLHRL